MRYLPPFSMYPSYFSNLSQEPKEIIDWGLQGVNIPILWSMVQGEGIKVAVLDTGIDSMHPDLKDVPIKGRDFTDKGSFQDGHNHGTFCAGIIAARKNNVGVIGVAPRCSLLVGKVLSDSGSGTDQGVADGIRWAVDEGADIISLSLGGPYPSPALTEAVAYADKHKVTLIAAAGNEGEGEDSIGYPAAFKNVIAVGSVKRGMKRSNFSSTGKNLAIMAPGEDILSCTTGGGYGRFSGTSFACPFIVGVVALVMARHRVTTGDTPCETPKQVRQHLVKVAKDLEDNGWDKNTGWGLVQPKKSLLW